MAEKPDERGTDHPESDKVTWLAEQIFQSFPEDLSGLKFYVLTCGCVHYQRVFLDGNLAPEKGIYRSALDGPCDACMLLDETWRDRVVDETVVYNSKLKIDCRE